MRMSATKSRWVENTMESKEYSRVISKRFCACFHERRLCTRFSSHIQLHLRQGNLYPEALNSFWTYVRLYAHAQPNVKVIMYHIEKLWHSAPHTHTHTKETAADYINELSIYTIFPARLSMRVYWFHSYNEQKKIFLLRRIIRYNIIAYWTDLLTLTGRWGKINFARSD